MILLIKKLSIRNYCKKRSPSQQLLFKKIPYTESFLIYIYRVIHNDIQAVKEAGPMSQGSQLHFS